ncbi:MAG: HK97 family phage prohead protease [Bacteroidaceae bacterium]|nr:HK97 family phage prohead protease [Bacteroidaceae bacterium]
MKQTRFIPIETCGLQLREQQEGQTESREIEGRPIIFGVRSVNLTPWSSTRKVYEVLEPGCISRELLQKSDLVLNLNHNSDVVNVLGRYRNNPERDTLKLEMRGDGIDCRCELPHTNNANDTLELIRRGDITGMSFAFSDDYEDTENGVSYERTNDVEDGKEVWLRHVKRINGLYDVSIVTHPAYEQTSVATRELSEAINKAIDAQLKREQPQETEEEKQAREAKEREANGGETNAEKEAREAREKAEREANGGETNAEKAARELRERQEREAEKERERIAAQRRHLRNRARRISSECLETLEY